MLRWVIIFLLMFLPLQATWAVAGSYCQHETGQAAQHFGHHAHRHHEAKTADHGHEKKSKPNSGAPDNDCGSCHSCGEVLVAQDAEFPLNKTIGGFAGPYLNRPLSGFVSRLYRPNWSGVV
jgi:hypothetical protein